MEDAGLRGREEGVSRQHEPVPERKPPVDERFANGRPPRQVRERQIGEDGVLNALDAGFRRDAPPGIVAEEEVGRTVDLAAQEGPAGEEERQQREKDRDPERDAGHEPAREKDGRRRRGRPGQPEREDFDFQIRRSRRRF